MHGQQQSFGLPKPGRALISVMILLTAIWVFFAAGINWAKSGEDVFGHLWGSDDILRGQLWRLVTAPLLHQPTGPGSVGHLLFALFGLYFLGATLEERWGKKRFIYFLIGAGVFASALQVLVTAVIAPLHQPYFFGSLGVVDAIAIAWALSFRGQQVRLFFVLPVSGTGLIVFVVAVNVLYILAMEERRDGLVTPFGGMLFGFLFAEGSPVRRWYLQRKLDRLKGRAAGLGGGGAAGVRKARPSHLRVIEGGEPKPDKRTLN